ncbi:MAG: ubiquinol-cytochrome C chaperone family protein [Alphaproteobacteria bacterium]
MLLDRLFRRSPVLQAADRLYGKVVAQARQPAFYATAGVPDTLDGRFDMITVHLVLAMRRLKAKDHAALSQALFDTFFKNMDSSLREMGVGDLTVPKRIRSMAEAFYGRVKAYEIGLEDEAGIEVLALALARNVFRQETDVPGPGALGLAEYMRRQDRHLAGLDDATLVGGDWPFLEATLDLPDRAEG